MTTKDLYKICLTLDICKLDYSLELRPYIDTKQSYNLEPQPSLDAKYYRITNVYTTIDEHEQQRLQSTGQMKGLYLEIIRLLPQEIEQIARTLLKMRHLTTIGIQEIVLTVETDDGTEFHKWYIRIDE